MYKYLEKLSDIIYVQYSLINKYLISECIIEIQSISSSSKGHIALYCQGWNISDIIWIGVLLDSGPLVNNLQFLSSVVST